MKTMSYNNDYYPYIDPEFDDNFLSWYELEGISKISEHSRQIRSLLNYKSATIRYFYSNASTKTLNSKFLENKKEFELKGFQLIKIINNIKDLTGVLEEGIIILQNDALDNYKITKAYLIELKKVINELFIKIHFFSEQDIHQFPRFLIVIIKIANEVCKVQKYLNKEFSEFYQELEENYSNLERELNVMLPKESVKNVMNRNNKNKLLAEELLQ